MLNKKHVFESKTATLMLSRFGFFEEYMSNETSIVLL